MPNRSTAINLRRFFLNIQMSSDDTDSRAVHSFWMLPKPLTALMEIFSYVQLLYDAPSARIRAKGLISESFALKRGTRQGCPLSLFLFALVVEPLVCVLRFSLDMIGFKCGALEECISS